MKRMNILGVFLLLILVTIPLVAGEFIVNDVVSNTDEGTNFEIIYTSTDSNFIVSATNPEINICKCGSSISYFKVSNVGALASKYYIDSNQDYITFSENEIVLLPGESKQISAYYQASCNAYFKDTAKITVNSIDSEEAKFEQKINFKNCQNLAISLETINDTEINPCQAQTFNLRVSNVGSFDEIYSISVNSDISKYVTFSDNNFPITANEYRNILVHFSPTCDMYGDYTIDFTVKAKKNDKISKTSQSFNISQNYNFDLFTVSENISVCPFENQSTKLYIENYDNFSNEYVFDIDAPNFVLFKFPEVEGKGMSKSLFVSALSKTSIPIIFEPELKHIDNYNISIGVKSVKGDVEKEISLPLNVENCYDFNVDIPYNKLYRCGKDNFNQGFSITNDGVKTTDVTLVYKGPQFGHLNQTEIEITPNGEPNYLDVLFEDVYDIKETYYFEVDLYHKDELKSSDKMKLVIDESNRCYNLVLRNEIINVEPDFEKFELNIKNKGTRYGTYSIEMVDSPNYLYLNQSEVSLGVTEASEITVYVNRTALEHYADLNNNGSLIGLKETPTIIFNHVDSNTKFEYNLKFKITNYPWYERAGNFIYSITNCILIFFTMIFTIIIFAVLLILKIFKAKNRKATFMKNNKLAWLLLIFFLVIASLIFFNYGCPFNNLSSDSPLDLYTYQDNNKTIDLADYFVDEDGDIISYDIESIEPEDVVEYIYNQSNVTFIPQNGWFGNLTIYLSATDAYNETAFSSPVSLKIVEVKEFNSVSEWFNHYCPYFNLILLLILFVLIWSVFSFTHFISKTKRKQMEREKRLAKLEKKNKKVDNQIKKNKKKPKKRGRPKKRK